MKFSNFQIVLVTKVTRKTGIQPTLYQSVHFFLCK